MAATASYRAVPSMLMVAPTGSTKRAIWRSTPQFSRRHFMVIGKVAELRKRTGSGIEGWDKWRVDDVSRSEPCGSRTWMMWPARWRGPAAALGCTERGSCEWRSRRTAAAGWDRARTSRTGLWWSTCPVSLPGEPGRACPRSFLPPGTQYRRGSTCVVSGSKIRLCKDIKKDTWPDELVVNTNETLYYNWLCFRNKFSAKSISAEIGDIRAAQTAGVQVVIPSFIQSDNKK